MVKIVRREQDKSGENKSEVREAKDTGHSSEKDEERRPYYENDNREGQSK